MEIPVREINMAQPTHSFMQSTTNPTVRRAVQLSNHSNTTANGRLSPGGLCSGFSRCLASVAIMGLLLTLPTNAAENEHVTVIDFPGAVRTDGAFGINARGDITGRYLGSDGVIHGYLLRQGVYTSFDAPGALQPGGGGGTRPLNINGRGDIAGRYVTADGRSHGFVLQEANFVTIDVPGAIHTSIQGNNTRGQLVGHYSGPGGLSDGFLFDRGNFTFISFPGAVQTQVLDISESEAMVGSYAAADGSVHGSC